jgi:membrane-anchored protein YejM (alkaline phosphatase superfamily)
MSQLESGDRPPSPEPSKPSPASESEQSRARRESRECRERRGRVLAVLLAGSYLLLLALSTRYLATLRFGDPLATAFTAAAFLTYCAFYVLVPFTLVVLLHRTIAVRPARRLLAWLRLPESGFVYASAVLLLGGTLLLIVCDTFIYRLYGFHWNGFVWNLVFTRGGIESMGATGSTELAFGAIVAAVALAEIALLVAALRSERLREFGRRLSSRRALIVAGVALLLLSVAERATYAVCSMAGRRTVTRAAQAVPFYLPLQMRRFCLALGLDVANREAPLLRSDDAGLSYPLRPIVAAPGHARPNVIWLVAESLRADALDSEIMPATTELARRSTRFAQHYSGGNATRTAVFSLFYGLYGSYWDAFLAERRAPVLLDVLRRDDYQLFLYTSAAFSFPEFDRTVFSGVDAELLHECREALPGWERDRRNVTALTAAIGQRDPARPFFAFMFFESPHAPYDFPEECAVREPYARDVNYATIEKADMGPLKNRYWNACRHLDTQLERVYRCVEAAGLLDRTIVLVTGDHGEEFMEKGRWGHKSAFSEEQTRVPLVLSIPGRPPAVVERMTSHLDVAPTMLALLGVANPEADYCLGFDLLGPVVRKDCVVCDYTQLALVDPKFKGVFPTSRRAFTEGEVTTKEDAALDDDADYYTRSRKRIVELMSDLNRFGLQH